MMAEYNNDNQANPLAPANIYGRSDEEEFPFAAPRRPKREHKSSKCPVYFLLLVTIASTLVLIFASVVLRVAAPKVTLNSVTVQSLSSINTGTTASINGTLEAEIDIDNNNFGYFGYVGSSITFLYQNVTLGVANITGGRVSGMQTHTVNVTVQVRSSYALAQDQNFTSDLSAGVLELRSFALVAGRVHIRKLLNRKSSNLMNCTMNLVLTNQTIQDLRC